MLNHSALKECTLLTLLIKAAYFVFAGFCRKILYFLYLCGYFVRVTRYDSRIALCCQRLVHGSLLTRLDRDQARRDTMLI